MRCIIHIGTEKTGSTAVQDFLFSNRSALKIEGAHVCTSAGGKNNRALPAAFMSRDKSDDFFRVNNIDSDEKRNSWRGKLLQDFTKEVREAARSSDVFLISSEHFHSRLLTPAEVIEFHQFMATLFDDFKVICYLRRQDQMALSRYSQALRAGFTPGSPLPPLRRKPFIPVYFNFQALLRRWAQPFGKATIRPRIYSETELIGGDVVQDFIDTAGLNIKPGVHPRATNRALSAEAQSALWSINKRLCNSDEEVVVRLRGRLVEYLEKNAQGRSYLPTIAEAREFYEPFLETNNTVARHWFGRVSLFDTDFSGYPAEPETEPVSAERVLDLLAGFMLEIASQELKTLNKNNGSPA